MLPYASIPCRQPRSGKLIEGDSVRSSIVLLTRSLCIPKREWREPSGRRTLLPIDIDPLLKSIWQANQPELPEQGSLVVSLQPDGSTAEAPSIRPLQGQKKALIGVFDFSFVTHNSVRVILREEACASQLGTPRRPTRQIGLLRPWKPVRVLLNGRSTSYSGQYYLLREYHLALCNEPVPDRIEATRFVNLQADLL